MVQSLVLEYTFIQLFRLGIEKIFLKIYFLFNSQKINDYLFIILDFSLNVTFDKNKYIYVNGLDILCNKKIIKK